MRVCRQQYKARDGKTRESANWYAEVKDHNGRYRRIPGFTDKGATAELGRQVERLISLRAVKQPPPPELSAWLEGMPATFSKRLVGWGILDQRHAPHGKTLLEHLKDFREALVNKGGTEMHADIVAARVRNLVQGCRFVHFADISASAVSEFLGTCRRNGLPKHVKRPDGKRSQYVRPMSYQTSNFYLKSFKQFCRWLVADRRATESPVTHLEGVNVDLDRRHDRRNLTADELCRLLTAAGTGPTHHALDRKSRALLYRVAMETGFRRSELATLTGACIDTEADVPTISVLPEHTKNRQGVTQPIRRELASELKRFIEARGLGSDARLWPNMTRNTSKMVQRDLKAARDAWLDEAKGAEREKRERSDFLAYVDSSGRFADFHAFRHSFISLITQGGVHPKLAQRLARHSDINLTMSRYSHTLLADEAEALAVLPAFPSTFDAPECDQEALAATGTNDVCRADRLTVENVLPTRLPKPDAETCTLAQSNSQLEPERSFPFEGGRDREISRKQRENRRVRSEKESGEAGIRTLGTLAGTLVFETSTIGHSVTSPKGPAVGRIILLNANCFQTYEGPEFQGPDSMLNSGRRIRRERKRSRPDAPRDSPPRESGASSE
jgi:integrase